MYPPRRIRSFVLRAGRVTAAQERALQESWPRFGIDYVPGPMDLGAAFGRVAPCCLEIGFGAGEVIGRMAEVNPQIDYLGIEVHRAGVGRLLLWAEEFDLANVRVLCHDAVDVLRDSIPDQSFEEIWVFFPDPWHKKRHRKRRLIDPQFVALAAAKLRVAGILRLATDWQDYAQQMLEVCNSEARLESLSLDGTFVAKPEFRSPTRFERRGERLGHGVWDLAYRKRESQVLLQEAAADTIDDELHREGG